MFSIRNQTTHEILVTRTYISINYLFQFYNENTIFFNFTKYFHPRIRDRKKRENSGSQFNYLKRTFHQNLSEKLKIIHFLQKISEASRLCVCVSFYHYVVIYFFCLFFSPLNFKRKIQLLFTAIIISIKFDSVPVIS